MQNVIQKIKLALGGYYPEPEMKNMVKILLNDVFHFSMLDIYMGKDIKFSEKQLEELNCILERLKNHEPIQYITGYTEFYGMKFNVNKSVLIPRPETTELIELIVRENVDGHFRILDIGTGSGCIAITLSLNIPESEVCAWDVSPEALAVASENAARLHARVCFDQQDVLKYLPRNERFDLIVSNPPYVMESEKKEMEKNVLDWEPGLALFVPDQDPLLFYRRITELGLDMLTPGGKICFEINRAFGKETKEMMESLGYHDVCVFKDLSGNDRMIRAIL